MQTLGWYLRRLQAMSPGEMAWRAKAALRAATDPYRLPARLRQSQRLFPSADPGAPRGFQTHDGAAPSLEPDQRVALLRRADRIVAGRLTLFDLVDHPVGSPPDWNFEYKAGVQAPLIRASSIDYRDHSVTGDCKFVWEPNRHQHFVVLGRAYRASGDERYAREVVRQWEDWLERCPPCVGMNWRSPLEFGIRLINWVWAMDLLRGSLALTPEFTARALRSVWLQSEQIRREYSYGSSANNHLIGEAAGVFVANAYFLELPDRAAAIRQAQDILMRALIEQTTADGGGREQAFGYHVFVMQFFVICGWVARAIGVDFPEAYWRRVRAMLHFQAAMLEGGAGLPMVGDADDGYVLDLDDDPRDPQPWFSIGASLLNDPRLKQAADGRYSQAAVWLLGEYERAGFAALPAEACPSLGSQSFEAAGYSLLQCGGRGAADRISVLVDHGELGLGAIAAHGHADALSLTLRVAGEDVLIDPGTYDYFSYGSWRDYFRGTAAHNTVEVDRENQSRMQGPFLWAERATARRVQWSATPVGARLVAEHDGYRRQADPLRHQRTVELSATRRELVVVDEFDGQSSHEYLQAWHFSEFCEASLRGRLLDVVTANGVSLVVELDERLELSLYRGSESPRAGWVSRGYHRKAPSPSVFGRCAANGRLRLVTRFCVAAPLENRIIGQSLGGGECPQPIGGRAGI